MSHIKVTIWNYFKYQTTMKGINISICSNNNDESIEVVISVLVSGSVLFIADISVIRILVINNLLIGVPLIC